KGTVPWDGIARRALVDVIPMYLSQISAALTGKEQVVFDYEKGIYSTADSPWGNFNRVSPRPG
ncbi:MAG: hypothetical protein K2P02_03155, partial [Lachnospiraceae bacterium]|nr:hypothetical protein [Lachnospiraceae bacterium]